MSPESLRIERLARDGDPRALDPAGIAAVPVEDLAELISYLADLSMDCLNYGSSHFHIYRICDELLERLAERRMKGYSTRVCRP